MLKIEKDKALLSYNTMAFAANADYYVKINSEEALLAALEYTHQHALAFHVLSGGSNILINKHVEGLVLHMQQKGITMLSQDAKQITLQVCAGENWHDFVSYCVENSWQGIENMALIPGLVGAAPVQNIGAYGTELKHVLSNVRAYDTQLNTFTNFNNSQCQFDYRDSVFKQHKNRYIITSVDIVLNKEFIIDVKYQALQNHLNSLQKENVSLSDVFEGVCAVRASKLPDPKKIANAGSFFKNPCIEVAQYEALKMKFPLLVGYPVADKQVKIAAGWLIEHCGWKGHSNKGVGVYEKQALVLIHEGDSNLEELLSLAHEIQQSIKEMFNVYLEVEPQLFP